MADTKLSALTPVTAAAGDLVYVAEAQGTSPETYLPKSVTAQSIAGLATWERTVALSDETTPITAGTAKITFRMPFAVTLTAVRASVSTASSVGTVTVDINEAGVSILSTKLTIDATEKTSTTAATPAVISDSALADDAEITIDVDDAGDAGGSPTTQATGLKVTLVGVKA